MFSADLEDRFLLSERWLRPAQALPAIHAACGRGKHPCFSAGKLDTAILFLLIRPGTFPVVPQTRDGGSFSGGNAGKEGLDAAKSLLPV